MSHSKVVLDEITFPSTDTLRVFVLAMDATFSEYDVNRLKGLGFGPDLIKMIEESGEKLQDLVFKMKPDRQGKVKHTDAVKFAVKYARYADLLSVSFLDLGIPMLGTVYEALTYEKMLNFQHELAFRNKQKLTDLVDSRVHCIELVALWRLLPILRQAINDYQPEMVVGKDGTQAEIATS